MYFKKPRKGLGAGVYCQSFFVLNITDFVVRYKLTMPLNYFFFFFFCPGQFMPFKARGITVGNAVYV